MSAEEKERKTLYKNRVQLNNGFSLVGSTPLDDREVFGCIDDLYIDQETRESGVGCHPLYNRAYAGMTVKVKKEDAPISEYYFFTLNDPTPYLPDADENDFVDESNLHIVWTQEGKKTEDHIAYDIDPSINAIEDFLRKDDNIISDEKSGITVLPQEEEGFQRYSINVNVDGDTIGINAENNLQSVQYTIRPFDDDNDANDYIQSYALYSKRCGETEWSKVDGSEINIAKDFVLREIHICKGTMTGGVFRESSQEGDPDWNDDENPVYLHFIWSTKDTDDNADSDNVKRKESYLCVSDIIKVDIKEMVDNINATNASVYDIENIHLPNLEQMILDTSENLDSSLSEFSDYVERQFSEVEGSIDMLDASLGDVTDYVNSSILFNLTNGGLSINAVENTLGQNYYININTDEKSVKCVENVLRAWSYRLERTTSSNADVHASYRLMYQIPGQSTWNYVQDSSVIDIPKDYVLNDVHLCKATKINGVIKETAKENDLNWDNADGSVYLHFEWATKDNDHNSSTWLNVSDVIKVDVAQINRRMDEIDSSMVDIYDYTYDDLETRLQTDNLRLDAHDGQINELEMIAGEYRIHRLDSPEPNASESYMLQFKPLGDNQFFESVESDIINIPDFRANYNALNASLIEIQKRFDDSLSSVQNSIATLTDLQNRAAVSINTLTENANRPVAQIYGSSGYSSSNRVIDVTKFFESNVNDVIDVTFETLIDSMLRASVDSFIVKCNICPITDAPGKYAVYYESFSNLKALHKGAITIKSVVIEKKNDRQITIVDKS